MNSECIIIGAGPAGLMAALADVIQHIAAILIFLEYLHHIADDEA